MSQKLIKIIFNLSVNRNLSTILLFSALNMTRFTALNASKEIELRGSVFNTSSPHFEASDFLMSIQATSIAFNNVSFYAVDSEMSYLVALEAYFLSA